MYIEPQMLSGTIVEKGPDGNLRIYPAKGKKKGRISGADFNLIDDALMLGPKKDKKVAILGGGVAGLSLAYDLLKEDYEVTLIEASHRMGGRSLTLRKGDSFTEEVPVKNQPGKFKEVTQTCTFEQIGNDAKPYLNAGPGRIPSSHFNVINLCKHIGVDLEVYIMESRSNRYYSETGFGKKGKVQINRQIANDTRGRLAAMLYQTIEKSEKPIDLEGLPVKNLEALKSLLIKFGALQQEDVMKDGKIYREKGKFYGSSRSGYKKLPTTGPGEVVDPFTLAEILQAKFWNHAFYQPMDWFWQTTSFQPVGGMDQIEVVLEKKIRELIYRGKKGRLIVNAPVTRIQHTEKGYQVTFQEKGQKPETITVAQVASNIPIPLLKGILHTDGFSEKFTDALKEVYKTKDFLCPTCKVGWQARRELWQNSKVDVNDPVIPIFGGISFTEEEIQQIWYPSNDFHDELGTLTGAYNTGGNAEKWGYLMPQERIDIARKNAENLHGKAFASELKQGVSIAWQNIPYLKGGWVDWAELPEKTKVDTYNTLLKGDNQFFIIGDQTSANVGWKEGALYSANHAFCQITKVKGYLPPVFSHVPDSTALTEGYFVTG